MHRFKRWYYILLGIILLIIIFFHDLIGYGIAQGYGQVKIILKARPVAEVMQDASFPDSLKSKLELIQEIRKFAFDSLGINYSENYTTVYDQKGKPLLWVITASEPFQLKAKKWTFPFLGSVSYKGFFDREKAENEENKLAKEGFDTSMDEVSGWSTLGWFKDPVLSEMLKRSPGSLANLIIHELTHGTLYVKDSVEFNENLASFVGDKGALKFLLFKYGVNSPEYRQYVESRSFMKVYTRNVLKHADRLDSLYNSFDEKTTMEQKRKKKEFMLKEIAEHLNRVLDSELKKGKWSEELESLNNTYFLDFRRYRENLDFFEKEFVADFNSDLKLYMEYLKNKYPSL